MTIQQLRYFLALCQDLNYTRTAGRMYLSRRRCASALPRWKTSSAARCSSMCAITLP